MSREAHRQPPTPINSLWQTYRQILPADASLTQIKETRRAFYAGCLGLFQLMVKSSDQEEEKAMLVMNAIDDEIQLWLASIGGGDDQN